MNDFDKASRYLAKIDPPNFYRWLLSPDVPLIFREWYDPRTLPKPGERDRVGDLVAFLAPNEASEITTAVITEFQSENDAEILERLLEEVARFRREFLPRRLNIFGAVVNLTGPRQKVEMSMKLPGKPKIGLRMRALSLTLRNESAAAFLAAIAEGRSARTLLPWVPLMRGGGEQGIIQEWIRLAESEVDPRLRADYGMIATIWMRLLGASARLAWEQGLKEYNMTESPFMQELVQKGRLEGELKNQRETVLGTIQMRFGTPVPAELVAAINATNDLAELKRWFKILYAAKSLDEFQTAIGC